MEVQTLASGQQDPQSGGNRLGDWLAGTLRSNQANQELEARQRELSASRSVLSEDDIEDRKYGWWWLLPLQPFSLQKTLREEAVSGQPDVVQIEPDGGFAWQEGWRDAFASVAGRVIVPPILRKLVLNRIPEQVQSRVAEIAEWDIQYVMAAHFSSRVPFTSAELVEAFAFLEGSIPEDDGDGMNEASSFAMRETGEDQCSLLNQISTFLVEKGLAASNNNSKETAP